MAIGAIVGAVIAGGISAIGSSSAAGDASSAANNAAQLQMQEFQTAEGLTAPGRNLGYGADNLLAGLYGEAPVYTGPSSLSVPNISGGGSGTPGIGNNLITAPNGNANFSSAGGSNPFGIPAMGNPSGYGNPNAPGGTRPAATPGATSGAAASSTPNYSAFYNSPGYQFTLQQGENAVNRNAAANGGLYSANTLTAENNYAQGAASTQYNNYVNQLLSMAGLGQAATSTTVGAGTAAAEGASNSIISAGNANASGVLGAAGGINNALTGNNGLLASYNNNNSNENYINNLTADSLGEPAAGTVYSPPTGT